ncbi:MAG: glycosyltransferase [Thermoplasmata archaeon]|nr:glycosyltransferase [Thermoplasmata archaeon]
MARLLFVYQRMVTFVEHDRGILSSEHELEDLMFPLHSPAGGNTVGWLLGRHRAMKAAMRDVDGVFVWFGDLPGASAVRWARKYGKRSIVVAGGYDGAYLPGTGYGLQHRFGRRHVTRYAFNNADLVLTVSKALRKDLYRFCRPRREVMIYNGLPTGLYSPKGTQERKALTVSELTPQTIWRKGVRDFVRAAESLADVGFTVVGRSEGDTVEGLKAVAPDNVTFTGFIPFEELLARFQSHKVYVQASAYESFGYAPAEAMLCGAVPVVTRRGALPEVVGDTGFYAPYGDPEGLADAIGRALASDKGPSARRRVVERFPLEKRRDALLGAVAGVLDREALPSAPSST